MPFLNSDYKMNKQRVSLYIERLHSTLNELESEIQSDSMNTLEGVDYQDILWYYKNHDENNNPKTNESEQNQKITEEITQER